MMGIEGTAYIRGLMGYKFPRYLHKRGWLYRLYKEGQKDQKKKDYSKVKFDPASGKPLKMY